MTIMDKYELAKRLMQFDTMEGSAFLRDWMCG